MLYCMHHERRCPVPFGKTQMHTRSTTNICTEVSRYLGNVDFVAPSSASLLSSPPSPCHPYDPRDFPSFLISIVPSGKRRSRPLDSSKWRKWEWSLSPVQGTLEVPHLLGFLRPFLLFAYRSRLLHRLRDFSRDAASPFYYSRSAGHSASRYLAISVRCHSKVQSSDQLREKSRSDGEGLFRWLDVRVCD